MLAPLLQKIKLVLSSNFLCLKELKFGYRIVSILLLVLNCHMDHANISLIYESKKMTYFMALVRFTIELG